ncbi:MAG: type II secretion system F family protein [Bdellovibrionota bacterium]
MGSPGFLLYGGLLFGGLSVYLFISALMSNNADKQNLSWANNSEPEKTDRALIKMSRPLVHQFTLQHALRIKNLTYRKRIKQIIKTAGISRILNEDEFIGMQILWGIMIPLFVLVMNFALELDLSYLAILAMMPFGFYAPIMDASAQKKIRTQNVREHLPFYIDLLALSVEAGLDFFAAIQMLVDKAEVKKSVLAEELSLVLKDVQLGAAKATALKEFAERLDMSEVTSFVAVLVDSEASGAPISRVLKEQTVQMRLERFVRAEKAGARASQALLIPMMVFIVPAVFIMVFGPVAISFMYGGK